MPALAAWRITSARYASRAFDGEGARLYGGRWNHPGTVVVYCSAALSLAALEFFIHLEPGLAPEGLVAIQAEIPEGVEVEFLDVSSLPRDWRTYPAPESLKDLGTAWARSGRTAILSVPSSVIPHERNILFNPAHRDFAEVRLGKAEPFSFDPRMWRARS
ncbi:MAG TPA: RES domain-containing protein [Thermoanaerobaculia bacterium]